MKDQRLIQLIQDALGDLKTFPDDVEQLDPIRVCNIINTCIQEPPGKGNELFWQLAGKDAADKWRWFSDVTGESLEVFWLATEIPSGQKPRIWSWVDELWESWLEERPQPHRMITLAASPYFLLVVLYVFAQTGTLPSSKGSLFKTFVDCVLEKSQELSGTDSHTVATRLAELGYAIQPQDEIATFSVEQIGKYLIDDQCLSYVCDIGLLKRNEGVCFRHQLLQEYFAANHVETMIKEKSAAELFPPGSWWKGQGQEEAIILLAGMYNEDCTPVVNWLHKAQPEVAARCIAESGAYCSNKTLEKLRSLWIPRLTDLENDPHPAARTAVGRALGRLRFEGRPLDNRKGVGLLHDGLPDIVWCDIPGIEGWHMLSNYKDWEIGVYDIVPFRLAKYPITYIQFQAFFDADDGWSDNRWWRGLPAQADCDAVPGEQAFQYDNHPREHVSWWNAVAFCAWFSTRLGYPTLHEWLEDGKGWESYPGVRLPTEWEWQWAAQGPKGWRYPYGDDFDAAKANTYKTGIGMTSAVGIFPNGASPYGVLDMSGNVWEWCLNDVNNREPDEIVLKGGVGGGGMYRLCALRGGSWDNLEANARTVSENYGYPVRCDKLSGFRVACSSSG